MSLRHVTAICILSAIDIALMLGVFGWIPWSVSCAVASITKSGAPLSVGQPRTTQTTTKGSLLKFLDHVGYVAWRHSAGQLLFISHPFIGLPSPSYLTHFAVLQRPLVFQSCRLSLVQICAMLAIHH
jgi:hypothetical protein